MKYLKRKYFPDYTQDSRCIWKYLSCREKIIYHQFQDCGFDYELLFCDDINICLCEEKDSLRIKRNCLKSFEKYFDVAYYRNVCNADKFIRDTIENGQIVGLNTNFCELPQFTWYKIEKHRNTGHYCMVVGYDDDNYLISDVPGLLNKEYMIYENVSAIPAKILEEQLLKRCNLLTIKEKQASRITFDDINVLVPQIITEYYKSPYHKNDQIVWTGKAAYLRLLSLIKMKDKRVPDLNIYDGPFYNTTIRGRHDLLKRCLTKQFIKTTELDEVLTKLEDCAIKWSIFATKVSKEMFETGFYKPDDKIVEEIYDAENNLINSLKKWSEMMMNNRD